MRSAPRVWAFVLLLATAIKGAPLDDQAPKAEQQAKAAILALLDDVKPGFVFFHKQGAVTVKLPETARHDVFSLDTARKLRAAKMIKYVRISLDLPLGVALPPDAPPSRVDPKLIDELKKSFELVAEKPDCIDFRRDGLKSLPAGKHLRQSRRRLLYWTEEPHRVHVRSANPSKSSDPAP